MHSIRTKVLLSGLAVILFIGLAIGITVGILNYRAAISEMESIITTSATTYAKSVANEIKLMKLDIEEVAGEIAESGSTVSE